MAPPQETRRGPWSSMEDNLLLSLVGHDDAATNWVNTASLVGTRSAKQCRERYHQNLKPSLRHDPISAEEGAYINKFVSVKGSRWAELARTLQGRSDNAVKNWWNGQQNRLGRNSRRNGNAANAATYGEASGQRTHSRHPSIHDLADAVQIRHGPFPQQHQQHQQPHPYRVEKSYRSNGHERPQRGQALSAYERQQEEQARRNYHQQQQQELEESRLAYEQSLARQEYERQQRRERHAMTDSEPQRRTHLPPRGAPLEVPETASRERQRQEPAQAASYEYDYPMAGASSMYANSPGADSVSPPSLISDTGSPMMRGFSSLPVLSPTLDLPPILLNINGAEDPSAKRPEDSHRSSANSSANPSANPSRTLPGFDSLAYHYNERPYAPSFRHSSVSLGEESVPRTLASPSYQPYTPARPLPATPSNANMASHTTANGSGNLGSSQSKGSKGRMGVSSLLN